ncbi:hypothetical protein ID866_4716 [Astraeus odoratus]|nr:hypothetical protein ID866_4716 [Astraeus odoratus]
MGVRAAVVVCVTSFLLGALFTHWIADSLTLWKSPVTDEHLWTAAHYYSILTRGPIELLYVIFTLVVLGAGTICWSLSDLEAGNLMFDGGSIVLYFTTVIMYPYTVIPNMVDKFSSLPYHEAEQGPFPHTLRSPTLALANNHLVCSVALTGVLILQASRWWAELSDAEEDAPYLQDKPLEGASTPAEEPIPRRPAPIPSA